MARVERHDSRLTTLPPRVLPLLYIGTAHVSLAVSLFCVAWWPSAVAVQAEAANRPELLRSRAVVVSVAEKARYQRVR